jgi:hypothetical protein
MKSIHLVFLALGLVACHGSPTSVDDQVPVEATQSASEGQFCTSFGPQTPRDISNFVGTNPTSFPMAPPASEMNLCNVHTHTNAEHKGPGFSVSAGEGEHGGFQCNETASLTPQELAPVEGEGAFEGVKPGDTIEVHWVFSSCDVAPGKGLGACLTEECVDPLLRVETQVFLVVNDPTAMNFNDFDYGDAQSGKHQPKSVPAGTGTPVVFLGSTTGPSYTQSVCSPAQVTWSVRPTCAKVDIGSLNAWAAKGNAFQEVESHGVRQLVTEPALLSPIQ